MERPEERKTRVFGQSGTPDSIRKLKFFLWDLLLRQDGTPHFLRFCLLILGEKGREGEREEEKHPTTERTSTSDPCTPPAGAAGSPAGPPTGNLVGVAFRLPARAPPAAPPQPGRRSPLSSQIQTSYQCGT